MPFSFLNQLHRFLQNHWSTLLAINNSKWSEICSTHRIRMRVYATIFATYFVTSMDNPLYYTYRHVQAVGGDKICASSKGNTQPSYMYTIALLLKNLWWEFQAIHWMQHDSSLLFNSKTMSKKTTISLFSFHICLTGSISRSFRALFITFCTHFKR